MSKRESGRKREEGNVQKYEIVIYQNDEQEKRKRNTFGRLIKRTKNSERMREKNFFGL